MNLPAPFQAACERWDQSPTDHCLHVNVAEQTLTHFYKSSPKTLVISTAVRGTGQKKDSNKTPLGLHQIVEKIGENEPFWIKMLGWRENRNLTSFLLEPL